ncbi:DUF7847 domain-containing protein [Haloarcula salina]|uniref:DUF7847 domain-containing protein n=1 Tax=Haloarcula salina TaxID=1429914 RepID=A0AA41FZH8_9EURY|nr:hypothetical protein [Haloarcula salina]MBV0900528.1 hypothetical protein [Haloarcula salina]
MAVLQALRDAVETLQRNPVLFVAAALYGLAQAPGLLLQVAGNPLLNIASSGYNFLFYLIMPFFLGGMISMAREGLSGPTDLSRLWSGGKTHYLQILVVVLLGLVVYFVVGFGMFMLVIALVLALGANLGNVLAGHGAGLGGVSMAAVALIGVLVLVFALVILAVLFLLQFYAHAIVVDDADAVGSLKRSYAVARGNVVSVLGYDLLATVLGVLIVAIPFAFVFVIADGFAGLSTASWSVRLAYVALTVVMSAVSGAFGLTFSTAFYVRLTGGNAGFGGGSSGGL